MLDKAKIALLAGVLSIGAFCGTALADEQESTSTVSKGPGHYKVLVEGQGSNAKVHKTLPSRAGTEPKAGSGAKQPREDPLAKWEREAKAATAKQATLDEAYRTCMENDASRCQKPGNVKGPDTLLWQVPTDTPAAATNTKPQITPGEAGAKAVARLKLPTLKARIGPDPSENEWGMIPVGYPVWLFADGETSLSDSDEVEELSVSLEAELTSMTFDMGDGTTVTCQGPGTVYSGDVEPATPSPTCGHTYQQVPQGMAKSYTVTATAHWTVTWTAMGESATVTDTTSSTTELPVGELQVVITE